MRVAEQNNAQIERLKGLIKDSFFACSEKDAIMPSSELFANLPGTIRSIQTGVPDGYINKNEIMHFATGIVRDVTAGQKFSVTGIKDAKTGEAFDVKGLVAFVEPSSTQNYVVSGTGKPAVIMFYRNAEITSGVALAAYNQALTIRANADFKDNDYIVINGNSFYFIQMTTSMYGVQASARWRWIAWG